MPRSSRLPLLLAATLVLAPACFLDSKSDADDDDDDAGSDTGNPGIGGGIGGGSSDGGGVGGAGVGGGSGSDGVSPVIVDGYAGYSDNGSLGITAVFTVDVYDPDDDLEGGMFGFTLDGGDPYYLEIGGGDVTYNGESVSLIFSNVEPVPYDVELQVFDLAGNGSNIWEGEMSW